MGHLGLCSAIAAAARGMNVVCFDPDRTVIDALRDNRLPIVEPDLPALFAAHQDRLSFTDNVQDLMNCSVITIAADVPTDDSGTSDLDPIRCLIKRVVPALARDAVLVVLSQVPPGFTRTLGFAPCFYQVETLIFGRAMERAVTPERIILGCADPAAALPTALQDFLTRFACPILPMRYESAEMCKISINAFLASSVTTANALAELSGALGGDWSEIVGALRLDRRIGPHAYLSPGLGLAVGNLERDLATIRHLADEQGTDAGIVDAWRADSRYRRDWVIRALQHTGMMAGANSRLAVLGLAYKENTASTRNSPALALLDALPGAMSVTVFDPVVDDVPRAGINVAASALEACRNVDAVAVMTNWPDFATLDPAALADVMRGRLVIDPLAVLDGGACRAAGLDWRALGMDGKGTADA
jgi:UDPglucose 6-dehydrogenase